MFGERERRDHVLLTLLQDGVPLRAINLLPANDVAGGVGKVNVLAGGVEIQGPRVHQVLDGDHVLIGNFGVHVHSPDDAGPTLTVHQEQLMIWLCRNKG